MSDRVQMSARDARRLALRAQGLLGPRLGRRPRAVLQHLRAVQIDTISVLARSHELVPFARLGPVPRAAIERAYWGGGSFEYWSHAACIVPLDDWPYFSFKRADRRARGRRWHHLEDADRTCALVLDKLRSEGPLTARQLGGAKRGGPWWDWSEVKIAAEWLLDIGDVICTKRVGFQRIYDLPERAVPAALLDATPDREEQLLHLLRNAASALGVATADDLAAYCGTANKEAARLLPALGCVPVDVEGWGRSAVADPELLAAGAAGLRSRPVLLSPFDSTIWYRPRVERVFDFHHRLEAYVPRAQRVHGYFSMPILVGDQLVGRVDPGRQGSTLVAKQVHLETWAKPDRLAGSIAQALLEAAAWVGSSDVALQEVHPSGARQPLEAALRAASLPGPSAG